MSDDPGDHQATGNRDGRGAEEDPASRVPYADYLADWALGGIYVLSDCSAQWPCYHTSQWETDVVTMTNAKTTVKMPKGSRVHPRSSTKSHHMPRPIKEPWRLINSLSNRETLLRLPARAMTALPNTATLSPHPLFFHHPLVVSHALVVLSPFKAHEQPPAGNPKPILPSLPTSAQCQPTPW